MPRDDCGSTCEQGSFDWKAIRKRTAFGAQDDRVGLDGGLLIPTLRQNRAKGAGETCVLEEFLRRFGIIAFRCQLSSLSKINSCSVPVFLQKI